MESSSKPKLLAHLDISNQDFLTASAYTPTINSHTTRTKPRFDLHWWLSYACTCCATTQETRSASDARAESCAGELVREAKGQGQVCVRINAEFFVGSGSVCLLGPATKFGEETKYFFLTSAHNFIHPKKKQELDGGIERKRMGEEMEVMGEQWDEAESAVFHYSKTGAENYSARAQVMDFRIHPKFQSDGAGFDIAVGLLAGNFENAPRCEDIYWSYYEYQAPLSIGDQLLVVGYPAERAGKAYEMSGTLAGVVETSNGGKLFMYNIQTYDGQIGSPVFLVRGDFTVLIGVHLGYDTGLQASVAAVITKDVYDWIYSQVNQ